MPNPEKRLSDIDKLRRSCVRGSLNCLSNKVKVIMHWYDWSSRAHDHMNFGESIRYFWAKTSKCNDHRAGHKHTTDGRWYSFGYWDSLSYTLYALFNFAINITKKKTIKNAINWEFVSRNNTFLLRWGNTLGAVSTGEEIATIVYHETHRGVFSWNNYQDKKNFQYLIKKYKYTTKTIKHNLNLR